MLEGAASVDGEVRPELVAPPSCVWRIRMRYKILSVLIWVLVASGAFVAARGGLDYWESRSAQRDIARDWNSEPAPEENPAPPIPQANHEKSNAPRTAERPRVSSAVAKLSIPRLDTVLYVVEGTDAADLKRGPGHLAGSELPGGDGNCVIAGHRDTHFRILREIEKGDEIVLQRNGKDYHYRVDEMEVVSPDNTASLQPTHEAVLNLITCFPFEYIGNAPKRFIVHAELENTRLSARR